MHNSPPSLKATFAEIDELKLISREEEGVSARLGRLYDAVETGKLDLDDLAPRIRELKTQRDELSKARVQIEAEMVAQRAEEVNLDVVKAYAQDLRSLLGEAGVTARKTFLRSFIRRIEISRDKVTNYYNLPLPQAGSKKGETAVLPIDTLGGPRGHFAQPKVETFFELSLIPISFVTQTSVSQK
jgi:site-specific DNA recombinase